MKTFHGARHAGYVRLWATDHTGAEVEWPELPAETCRGESAPQWGYPCDGTVQVARALLAHLGLSPYQARILGTALAATVLVPLQADQWLLTEAQLRAWLASPMCLARRAQIRQWEDDCRARRAARP